MFFSPNRWLSHMFSERMFVNANPYQTPRAASHKVSHRSRLTRFLLILDRLSRGELPRDYIAGVGFLIGSLSYFFWFRIRDFTDLSQTSYAEFLYPILFMVQPTTNLGFDATAWFSIGLWMTGGVFLVCYVARRVCDFKNLRPTSTEEIDA